VGPVTEQSEHLSNAQIENYGNRTSGAGPEAAQRDEHQRVNHQSTGDQSNDQSIDDQRVEAHLTDCPSCRNRVLDFHRSLFASPTFQPEPDRSKAGQPKYDALAHDSSLYGHLPSGYAPSGHLPLGQKPLGQNPSDQRPADSSLEGAKPTDSALADSNFANSKYPAEPQVRTAPTPECPSDDALRQLAASLTPDDAAAKLTQHAATCDHCGPLLRTFTEDFSDDFSPEEQAALAKLQSSSVAWQKNTAQKMLEAGGVQASAVPATEQSSLQKPFAKPPNERKPFFWKWALVPAIAAVVVLASITFPIYLARRDTPGTVEKLLAQAYTEKRTIEMRWPGAAYSRLTESQRGPNDPKVPQPTALLDAESAIGHALKKNPSNSEWLRLHAQSYILKHDPSSAITVFTGAQEAGADSPSTILGLAIAHFVQGQDSSDALEYKQAVKLLDKLLERQPENTVALFNRAIVYEHLHMYLEAAADWNALLLHETDEGWRAEAAEHLEHLQEKKTPG
jgi:cytochrome c-type biogenesis protein CcmH/NrfG